GPSVTGMASARSAGEEAVCQHGEELSGAFIDLRGARLTQLVATDPAGEQGDAGQSGFFTRLDIPDGVTDEHRRFGAHLGALQGDLQDVRRWFAFLRIGGGG